MAFWKKKDIESEEKCPLCGTVVTIDDVECPLCFYELKLSPRHQSLNITANEEDSLIQLLNADVEEEEEEVIREVEDVINLNAQEITVEAEYDDDEFISIPSEHAPEFVTSRMTPSGVVETDSAPEEIIVEEDDEEIDLGGISIPKPPSQEDIEYEEVTSEIKSEENDSSLSIELPTTPAELPPPPAELPPPPAELPPPPTELPPPPAELPPPPAELPPPPMELNSPYLAEPTPPEIQNPENKLLNKGLIWPWAPKDEWDAKNLRKELLEAMAAAKNNDNKKVEGILENIGPHLGKNIDLLFHVGVLLKRLGREYELVQMLTKAKAQFPENSDVANAISKLS